MADEDAFAAAAGDVPDSRPRLIRIRRRVNAATLLREAIFKELASDGVWPPRRPWLLRVLVNNLVSGKDRSDWPASVRQAALLVHEEIVRRRRKLLQNWNALEQVNALVRVRYEELMKRLVQDPG